MSQTETIRKVPVDELEPHPKNKEIYPNKDISDLKEKIEEYGFKDEYPLIVTPENKILSGHRRWRVAKELGIDRVPVKEQDPDSEREEIETILLSNRYRVKTPGEKQIEADMWEEIEAQKAQERMEAGGSQDFAKGETGKARDKAAEQVGWSGEKKRQADKVREKAEEGDEVAQEEWEKLLEGDESVNGAYSTVRESEKDTKEQPEDEVEVVETNEWRTVETRDVEAQARDWEDGIVVCIDGDDYELSNGLFESVFKEQ